MASFEDQDLTDAEFRECDLTRARLIGVVMQDAVIDGLISNLVVNGVEVTSYVEAELDRRHPVRLLIRSADPADLQEAFRQLRADWTTTLDRLRGMPKSFGHQRVGGEWSAVETLRHLVFVHDSWFRRCCLGSTEPFTAIGLAPEFVPNQEEQGLDRAATPNLDEVLAVRCVQGAELERWLSTVTPDQLSAPAPAGRGWPPDAEERSVLECVHVVLNEEWAHHGFCVRDLDLLGPPRQVLCRKRKPNRELADERPRPLRSVPYTRRVKIPYAVPYPDTVFARIALRRLSVRRGACGRRGCRTDRRQCAPSIQPVI
jgi:DinB superfamily/Pentapeptide repeats (8 copies)